MTSSAARIPAVKPRVAQHGLFIPLAPEPEKLELTLARINGIVGEGRAGTAELLDTHRDGAFEMRPFAPGQQEEKKSAKKAKRAVLQVEDDVEPGEFKAPDDAQEQMTAVIALRLFRPRLRAVVNVCEGKPVKLKCLVRKDVKGEIVWSAGPWRSSGDWSEQEGWSREEWDIAVPAETSLVLYRLVQDKLNGKWFVEGVYD